MVYGMPGGRCKGRVKMKSHCARSTFARIQTPGSHARLNVGGKLPGTRRLLGLLNFGHRELGVHAIGVELHLVACLDCFEQPGILHAIDHGHRLITARGYVARATISFMRSSSTKRASTSSSPASGMCSWVRRSKLAP